jgi:hypothetical protein
MAKAKKRKSAKGKAKKPARRAAVKAPARKAAKKSKRSATKAKRAVKRPAKAKKTKQVRKATKRPAAKKSHKSKEIFGEGNYTAAREFRKDEEDFVRANRSRIPAMGREAEAALEGPEGDDLRRAEAEARAHNRG